jgi:16S rRNA (guanine966-N2)-methyltransferase
LGRILMETRISGGSKRGHKLRSHGGIGLRPTSEKVRSAIFSLIGPESVNGARVLDLYAGTGALGIEALSRGAASAQFVESNPTRCGYIRRALQDLGFAERSRITRGKVEKVLLTIKERFDLVLADPPYRTDPWDTVMTSLLERETLEEGAVIVAEHAKTYEMADTYGDLNIWKRRRYGDTAVSIFRNGG